MAKPKRVCVIGSGITGLSAAWLLHRYAQAVIRTLARSLLGLRLHPFCSRTQCNGLMVLRKEAQRMAAMPVLEMAAVLVLTHTS